MKRNFKIVIMLLAVAVLFATMAVVAYAELTYPATGYVQMYESDKTTPHEGVEGDLVWTIDKEGEEVVLTITGEATTLTFNSKAAWNAYNGTTSPWYSYIGAVTKIVIDAPITAISQDCCFNKFANVHTVVLPETEIKLSGSMIFAGMQSLTTLGPEGTEEYTLDLRTLYGPASQPFDGACAKTGENTVTVLMPYGLACPMNHIKPFSNDTKVVFKVLAGSPSVATVETIKAHADDWDNYTQTNNTTPHTKYVSIEYYDVSEFETITGGIEGKYQYNFDLETGHLVILNKYSGGWQQFDTHGAEWQAFKAAWGSYVKTATVAYFQKISFGGASGTTPLFAGMANLESVAFQAGQRLQNTRAATTGWFQGCTALKSITFGGEPVEGVFNFSKMNGNKDDSPDIFFTNIFNGCAAVEEVIVPESAVITTVKASGFAGCTNLKKITIPENITTIEEGTFADCPDVVLTVVEDSYAHTWAVDNGFEFELVVEEAPVTFYEGRFAEKNDLTYYYDIATQVLTISGEGDVLEMDYVPSWDGRCLKDTNGDGINELVAELPWLTHGFANDVKKVVIEADITRIDNYMLIKLPACETIVIPETLKEIGHGALAYNSSLNSIKLAGSASASGYFEFHNIERFEAYVFDGALQNVTPIVIFSNNLKFFDVNKIAQKCEKLTLLFNGNEAARPAAGFIAKYLGGVYEGNADYCQNIEIDYVVPDVASFEGYSVRLTDYNGLRSIFSMDMNAVALKELEGLTLKEYGTIIGTSDNMVGDNWMLDAEGNISAEKIIKTPVYRDGEFVGKRLESSTETKIDFAVTLINIAEEHYDTSFCSAAYAIYEDAEGNITVDYCLSEVNNIKTVATNMYEAGLFDEETGPVAMEIVNYGKDAAEVVAYTEKCYL